jgi:hypothetical protein
LHGLNLMLPQVIGVQFFMRDALHEYNFLSRK